MIFKIRCKIDTVSRMLSSAFVQISFASENNTCYVSTRSTPNGSAERCCISFCFCCCCRGSLVTRRCCWLFALLLLCRVVVLPVCCCSCVMLVPVVVVLFCFSSCWLAAGRWLFLLKTEAKMEDERADCASCLNFLYTFCMFSLCLFCITLSLLL